MKTKWSVVGLMLTLFSIGCGIAKHVTIPPPGTDTTPPGISVSMENTATEERECGVNQSDRPYYYPPQQDFLLEASASDAGGVSKLELYDSWSSPNRKLIKDVKGDRSNPVDLLLFAYAIKNFKPSEEHVFGLVAEDFSGNRAEKGPLIVRARAKPSDLFKYCNPGTIVEITGVLTRKPGGDQFGYLGYNSYDPDFHYRFIADEGYAELANTLGTDDVGENIAQGGQFAPEQDGWTVDCEVARSNGLSPQGYDGCKKNAGPDGKVPLPDKTWITTPEAPGVYWPWDPQKDTFGNDLNIGDHIRMVGRLRYDHGGFPCWDSGVTAALYNSHPQKHGHAEIHPIDVIQKIPPLPPSAKTVVRLSVCATDGLFNHFETLARDLSPAAPRPSGSVVSVVEEIDGAFTVCGNILTHELTRSPGGDKVRVFVQVVGRSFWSGRGKFRAKYQLKWAAPGEAVLQKDSSGCGP